MAKQLIDNIAKSLSDILSKKYNTNIIVLFDEKGDENNVDGNKTGSIEEK